MYDTASGAKTETAIVQRDSLDVAALVQGPAIIVESQTSTVLSSQHQAIVEADGTLRITRRQGS